MLDIFVDQSVDPEVRIAAYLQVMRCPIYNVVRHIVNVLDSEGVNQGKRRRSHAEVKIYCIIDRFRFRFVPVGSFVWTHLQNLKKTSVPYFLELQTMLSGDIHKKFNTDPRKFSRNYEYSFFLSEYGVGKNERDEVSTFRIVIILSVGVKIIIYLFFT